MRVWLVVAVMGAVSAISLSLAAILEESWPLFLLFPGLALAIPLAREPEPPAEPTGGSSP